MILKVKKLNDKAVLPVKAHATDAGLDLTAIEITTEVSEDGRLVLVYHTGLSIEIPDGHMGLIFPRSSISKKSLSLTNAVGIVDSGYRGEIVSKFVTITNAIPAIYREGERFAQLVIVPYPEVTIEEVTELTDSDRGTNGFGSTGVIVEDLPKEQTVETAA